MSTIEAMAMKMGMFMMYSIADDFTRIGSIVGR